jgi:hypothetical protein
MSRTSVETSRQQSSTHVAGHRVKPKQTSAAGTKPGNKPEREEMIAVAAYYRAEHRGFDGGDPVADWLAAEAEIDAGFNAPQQAAVH